MCLHSRFDGAEDVRMSGRFELDTWGLVKLTRLDSHFHRPSLQMCYDVASRPRPTRDDPSASPQTKDCSESQLVSGGRPAASLDVGVLSAFITFVASNWICGLKFGFWSASLIVLCLIAVLNYRRKHTFPALAASE